VCTVTQIAQLDLPLDMAAPAMAREFLRERHCAQHHSSVLPDAELLVSELVTNGLRHGAPPIQLRVECEGDGRLRVSVRDRSPRLPQVGVPQLTDEGGRGMQLVDYISEEWGAVPSQDGKEVWFRLAA